MIIYVYVIINIINDDYNFVDRKNIVNISTNTLQSKNHIFYFLPLNSTPTP